MDSIIHGIESQFQAAHKPTLGTLREWQTSMKDSVYFSEPRATALPDPDLVLNALYTAYLRPRHGGSGLMTKGRVLDRFVSHARKRGWEVRRGSQWNDYTFDAVIDRAGETQVVEVLSFASSAKRMTPVEHDAGYFLHAIGELKTPGLAVVQPPSAESVPAMESFERVRRWFDHSLVPLISLDNVDMQLGGPPQLTLQSNFNAKL